MAKKPGTNPKGEFVFFDVVYEDGSQRSNRRVPAELLGGLEKDEPALGFIIEQDREIAEKSGRAPLKIESIARVGAKPEKMMKARLRGPASARLPVFLRHGRRSSRAISMSCRRWHCVPRAGDRRDSPGDATTTLRPHSAAHPPDALRRAAAEAQAAAPAAYAVQSACPFPHPTEAPCPRPTGSPAIASQRPRQGRRLRQACGAGAGAVRRALSRPRHRPRQLRSRAEGARRGDGIAQPRRREVAAHDSRRISGGAKALGDGVGARLAGSSSGWSSETRSSSRRKRQLKAVLDADAMGLRVSRGRAA